MRRLVRPVGAASALVLAGFAGPAPPAPPATSPWNTGTRPPAEPAPAPSGTSTIRVFEGFGTAGPLYGPRGEQPAYAIDVAAEMGTCPDGSRVVTAVEVAGARYPLDSRCPSTSAGAGSTGPPRPGPGATGIRCDARTWNCRSNP